MRRNSRSHSPKSAVYPQAVFCVAVSDLDGAGFFHSVCAHAETPILNFGWLVDCRVRNLRFPQLEKTRKTGRVAKKSPRSRQEVVAWRAAKNSPNFSENSPEFLVNSQGVSPRSRQEVAKKFAAVFARFLPKASRLSHSGNSNTHESGRKKAHFSAGRGVFLKSEN